MFSFQPSNPADKPLRYRELCEAADAITQGEPDGVANMANVAALVWHFVPGLNWGGFYRSVGGELVLGPFVGLPACIRIPFGKGVCGAAAETGDSRCPTSTPSPAISPAMRAAGRNWSCPSCARARPSQ